PVSAAGMLLIPSLATNVWQLLAGPATGRLLLRLWPMMLGIVLGTVGGSALLTRIDPLWSGLALGLALMAYASYSLASPSFTVPARLEPWLGPAMGSITGLIAGATGVFVMPAVPYLQALALDKDELVQALGLSFTVSTLALAVGLLTHDALHPEQLTWSIFALIPALFGMWAGQRIRARISARGFRLCFLSLLMLLGLELASRPLFA